MDQPAETSNNALRDAILATQQDTKDGEALRKLLEACPAGAVIRVESVQVDTLEWIDGARWTVDIDQPIAPLFDGPFGGTTIAEAAGLCRVALEVAGP